MTSEWRGVIGLFATVRTDKKLRFWLFRATPHTQHINLNINILAFYISCVSFYVLKVSVSVT